MFIFNIFWTDLKPPPPASLIKRFTWSSSAVETAIHHPNGVHLMALSKYKHHDSFSQGRCSRTFCTFDLQ